jgi:hypothetical protein
MRDHLPLDQDEAVGSLPVSNIWASTATPQLKLGELIERTKHMARGGGETQENDRFDDKDTMAETGNYGAHQLEGLLEDLEVDIESPCRLDLHLETSQKDLEVGSSTFEGVENLVVPINFEHDAVGQTEDQDQAFPPMDSHCDSGQIFVLPLAEEAAVAPNLLSGLPGVQDSPFPTKHSSEAACPSSAHPTNCLQHPQMTSLVSKSLL